MAPAYPKILYYEDSLNNCWCDIKEWNNTLSMTRTVSLAWWGLNSFTRCIMWTNRLLRLSSFCSLSWSLAGFLTRMSIRSKKLSSTEWFIFFNCSLWSNSKGCSLKINKNPLLFYSRRRLNTFFIYLFKKYWEKLGRRSHKLKNL